MNLAIRNEDGTFTEVEPVTSIGSSKTIKFAGRALIAKKVYGITKPSDRILIEFAPTNGGINVQEVTAIEYCTSTSIFSVKTKDILGNPFTVILDPGLDDFTWVLKSYVALDGFVEFV